MFKSIRGHHIWAAPLNSKSVVVDAGAHRGEFSAELLSGYGCQCFLVEANPYLAAELKVPGAGATISGALAAHDGQTRFHLSANPESGSIIADVHDTPEQSVEVETI